jgi:hypothetical protein
MKTLASILCRWPTFTAVLLTSMVARAECHLQTLTAHGSETRAGPVTVNLGEADNAANPNAWQGPLVAGNCTLDMGIIERPLLLTPANLLYVPSYSGSARTLALVDLNACSVRWQSAPFSGRLKIDRRALHLGGRRIALDQHCIPIARK